ncbi:hypothetical protein JCM17478_36190 [Thermopirellula anaerolimosa]
MVSYDRDHIVMDFWRANSQDMQIGHLRQRYLWGPAPDQILAEEAVDGGTADLVQWTLTDHLNTVRNIARFDPQTGTTTVVNRLVYDAFGRVTSESNPAVDSLFLFTARPFDSDTALQNNLNRWYDSRVGRWLSEDPIGFNGGDGNLYRYVVNAGLRISDPWGLEQNVAVGDGRWMYDIPVVPRVPNETGAGEASHLSEPLGPLTADEEALFGFCEKLDYSNCKPGCTKRLCKEAVETFIRAVRQTWILNIFGWPLGPNTCKRWANTCDRNFGDLEKTNPCVSRSEVCLQSASAYWGATNIHATFVVGLCRQFRMEADNGALGGEDHIVPTW